VGSRVRYWDSERRADLLAGTSLFAPLPPATTRDMAMLYRPRAVGRGDFIYHEGEPARAVHVAAEGRVKIVRETAAGRQVVLRLINPGEPFGISGGWGTATYPASARALDAGVVLQLPAREFIRLLSVRPELAMAVIADQGRRLRELESRVLDLETEGVEARLARALLRLIAGMPSVATPPVVALTRQDLADLTGTTLSTASRTLSAWHRRGIVAALRERVLILDRVALAVIAEGTADLLTLPR
jgi:CRP-like cAMP-binding protein